MAPGKEAAGAQHDLVAVMMWQMFQTSLPPPVLSVLQHVYLHPSVAVCPI